jgi:Domain of unknown function (DUF4190)
VTDQNHPEESGTSVPPASEPAPTYSAPAYGASSSPPPYGQAATGYGQPYSSKTNTLAIVSLVTSIAGIVILPFLGSLAGVICGHISLSQIKRTGEQGRGMALAGLIVGYVGLALAIVGLILLAVFSAWMIANYGTYTTY